MQKANTNLLLRTLLIAALAGVFSFADAGKSAASRKARRMERANEVARAAEKATAGRGGKVIAGVGDKVMAGIGDKAMAGAGDKLVWLNVEQATGKLKEAQKPVLIDMYTTWCGWCKRMDKATYTNKQVIQYLSDKFYPVRVDAESHDDITWNGRIFHFDAANKVNEFAEYIAHGQMEFPTTVIIPPGGEPMPIPGYMEPKQLEVIVKYFGEGNYGKIPFEEYEKGFKPSW